METQKHEATMHSPAAILAPDHILWGIMESVEPTGVQDGLLHVCVSGMDRLVDEEYYKFTDSGLERLDYGICHLEDVGLVAGGGGVSFAEYIGNLKQSQTFARGQLEIPCPE